MMQGLVGAGVPEMAATEVVRVFGSLRAGEQTETTDAIAHLTGRAGGSFADFARRHADVFGMGASASGRVA
jgi:aspartokinase-like uncharacterized kinase